MPIWLRWFKFICGECAACAQQKHDRVMGYSSSKTSSSSLSPSRAQGAWRKWPPSPHAPVISLCGSNGQSHGHPKCWECRGMCSERVALWGKLTPCVESQESRQEASFGIHKCLSRRSQGLNPGPLIHRKRNQVWCLFLSSHFDSVTRNTSSFASW